MAQNNTPKEIKPTKLEDMLGIEFTNEIKMVAGASLIFGVSTIASFGILAYEFQSENISKMISIFDGITIGASAGYVINYFIKHKDEYF